MNSISNISIFPEINSTSIWQTLVDNVLNGIAYLFAAILSTRARKIETAPVGVLQNTSAIETVLDIYGNAILRLAYSYLHNMFHTQIGVGNRLDGGRRRVKKYLWSFLRTAPAGQVRL